MSVRPKIFESVPSLSSRVSLLGSINGLTVARITFDFSYLRAYDPSGQPRCSSLSPLAYRTRTRLVPVPGSLRLLNQPCFDMFYISGMAAAATLGGKGHASARLGLICCKVYVSEVRVSMQSYMCASRLALLSSHCLRLSHWETHNNKPVLVRHQILKYLSIVYVCGCQLMQSALRIQRL